MLDLTSPGRTFLCKCLKPIFSFYCTVVRRQTLLGRKVGWEGEYALRFFVWSLRMQRPVTFLDGNQRYTHVSKIQNTSIQAQVGLFPNDHNTGGSRKSYQEMGVCTTGNMKRSHQTSRMYMQSPPPQPAPPLSVVWGSQSPRDLHTPQSPSKPVALNQG